jgi:hypothetical protein
MRCDAHGNRQCRLSWSKQSGYRQPVTSIGYIALLFADAGYFKNVCVRKIIFIRTGLL